MKPSIYFPLCFFLFSPVRLQATTAEYDIEKSVKLLLVTNEIPAILHAPNSSRKYMGVAHDNNGTLYFVGGKSAVEPSFQDLEFFIPHAVSQEVLTYTPASRAWISLAPLHKPRIRPSVFFLSFPMHRLVAIGGRSQESTPLFSSYEVLQEGAENWDLYSDSLPIQVGSYTADSSTVYAIGADRWGGRSLFVYKSSCMGDEWDCIGSIEMKERIISSACFEHQLYILFASHPLAKLVVWDLVTKEILRSISLSNTEDLLHKLERNERQRVSIFPHRTSIERNSDNVDQNLAPDTLVHFPSSGSGR